MRVASVPQRAPANHLVYVAPLFSHPLYACHRRHFPRKFPCHKTSRPAGMLSASQASISSLSISWQIKEGGRTSQPTRRCIQFTRQHCPDFTWPKCLSRTLLRKKFVRIIKCSETCSEIIYSAFNLYSAASQECRKGPSQKSETRQVFILLTNGNPIATVNYVTANATTNRHTPWGDFSWPGAVGEASGCYILSPLLPRAPLSDANLEKEIKAQ